jgi:DNA (cytosine-5)-methyltransferase 1
MTRTADIFCGVGGFSVGALRAGFPVKWCADLDFETLTYHAENHALTEHVLADVTTFDWSSIVPMEVLLASPPCQGFSEAGQPARRGAGFGEVDRARNVERSAQRKGAAFAIVDAAREMRPHTIIVENVVQMADRWERYGEWMEALAGLGYHVRDHRINALNYGGGQDRTRLIVTASLVSPIDLSDTWGGEPRTIGEQLNDDEDSRNRWRPVASKSEQVQRRIAQAQAQAGDRCFWANVCRSRGRTLEEHFPTSTTQSGTQWSLVDGDRVRVLNPEEIARSLGFPEDYVLPACRTTCSRMIGNAISAEVAEGVIRQAMGRA